MKLFEQIERLVLLHKLIMDKKTGTPDDLADRIGVSRSTLYNLIDELKSYDILISYSRSKQSFVYEDDYGLEIQYSVKVIRKENELTKINGGMSLFSFRPFFRRKDVIFVNISQPADFTNSII